MKKLLSFLLIITLIIITSANASALVRMDITLAQGNIEYINDNLYIETIITDATPINRAISTFSTNKTIAKSEFSPVKFVFSLLYLCQVCDNVVYIIV